MGWKYPRMVLVARLTNPEKLRVAMDEKRCLALARFFRELHKHVTSPLKA
jgi:hypothetical protein